MAALRRRSRRAHDDRGAVLVEFALILLPMVTILFGTIEFGWAFYQLNDIRHGAREGLRLLVVNSDIEPNYTEVGMDQGDYIAQAACERMDQKDGVTITIELSDVDSDGDYEVGDDAVLTASKDLNQLTGIFDAVLGGVVLEEKITSRLEQTPADDIPVNLTWECK